MWSSSQWPTSERSWEGQRNPSIACSSGRGQRSTGEDGGISSKKTRGRNDEQAWANGERNGSRGPRRGPAGGPPAGVVRGGVSPRLSLDGAVRATGAASGRAGGPA